MPKKSKREKIKADVRRTYTFEAILPEKNLPAGKTREETTELHLIKQDVTKTIILAILAISAELVLYWWRKGT
ncbi:MAG: hypothetical protein UY49_C0020G0010 [Microgenomates group bacterium GW2011_GWC1_49_7]|nr:MAG: hypothetical protein UY49_C0020G0010 [Microgenomates group bacterium GW2011_GWC1_49_7]